MFYDSKLMKVALLAPTWREPSGWSRVVEKMTPLIAEKVDVTLYLPSNSPRYMGNFNFNVRYTLPPISYHPLHYKVASMLVNFINDLRKEKYDVIQTYDAWPLSFMGALGSITNKVPLFTGAHGTAAISPLFNWKLRHSLIFSYKISRVVFCISNFTKNILEKLTGFSKKFLVLPLDGVDFDFFAKRRDISKLEEIWRPGRIILTVAKLKERKGIDVSLRAFKYVKEKFNDVKYIIIGSGDPAKYAPIISQLKLRDVYFLGPVSDEELAMYYQLCDVFVMTPKSYGMDVEGFGLVYLEAGAAERPVVASASGGVVDIVKHMENGLLVPENDPRATAEAILKILSDEELARRLGSRGSQIARKYSWQRAVESLINAWKTYI